jgi:hypothetical protein
MQVLLLLKEGDASNGAGKKRDGRATFFLYSELILLDHPIMEDYELCATLYNTHVIFFLSVSQRKRTRYRRAKENGVK